MSRHTLLRTLALVLLAGAVLDPGCAVTRRPALMLVASPEVAPQVTDRLRGLVAEVYPTPAGQVDGPATVRIGVGSPRSLLEAHRERPLTIAVRTPEAARHVSDVVAPRLLVAGLSSVLRVHVEQEGAAPGTAVDVSVRDVSTGQRVGAGRGPMSAHGRAWVDVSLLPPAVGPWALCIAVASSAGDPIEPCEPVDVRVLPSRVRVEVLEARPSWAARFARLALQQWDSASVHAIVRAAPTIKVATRPANRTPEDADGADVLLVGGLDALTTTDVARLTREARDQGRTVVLLADGPVDGARLGTLWPSGMTSLVTAPAPLRLAVGPHAWRAREWLAPPTRATDVEPLAYLDAIPPVPVVLARALGTGRVVVVTAIDTWRWRAADDVTFEAAWQTLVLSLAADAALARQTPVWRLPGALGDEVHVARVRSAAMPPAAASAGRAPVRLESDAAREGPWVAAGTSDLRARLDLAPATATVRVVLDGDDVGDRSPDVIEVGSAQPLPSAWSDVRRRVEADGGRVVDEQDLPNALQALDRPAVVDGTRWFVTRHWWFAAGVIGVLGLEWWWRRLARLR